MIRSNDLEKKVKLGCISWDYDSDEGMWYLGSLSDNLKVYCDYSKSDISTLNVYVVDYTPKQYKRKPRLAMDLFLKKVTSIEGLPTYSVGLVGVDDLYKGFNLAPKVYAFLLKQYKGWVLRSGASQSPGGRSIWNSLCKERGVSVYVANRNTKDYHKCQYGSDGDIMCPIDLYEGRNSYYLYATSTK